MDSGVYNRFTIPHYYDPMISKLVVWGRDREEAIIRMRRALYEYIIVGVITNIPFHKAVMENRRFVAGDLGTMFIENETTLIEDMKKIMTREQPLQEKLQQIFAGKRKNRGGGGRRGHHAYEPALAEKGKRGLGLSRDPDIIL